MLKTLTALIAALLVFASAPQTLAQSSTAQSGSATRSTDTAQSTGNSQSSGAARSGGKRKSQESSSSRKAHEQILKAYGVYADQALQDYVSEVGQRVARQSSMPDEEWKFVVLDDDSLNAFTTGCCFVYLHRGLLLQLNSEAELAAVLGHEIAHVTAKHPQKRMTRGVLASLAAAAAAIATNSGAVADLANLGANAWMQGYGRDNELEADRIGLQYSTRAGYRPEAMGEVFEMFRRGERFEIDRARAEGREPRIYHGLFSSHPTPDARAVQAAKTSARLDTGPPGGWVENRERYMRAIDGLTYGSSRAQGIVRENRLYHAELGITVAFPRAWTVENQRDALVAYTPSKDTLMQITLKDYPPTQGPREFLLSQLRGASLAGGEAIEVNGMQGYSVRTTAGSPLDNGAGPVRWTVLYRGKSAYLFAGASRSSRGGVPEADGLFLSVAETLRSLKPAEYPLAEPYRLRIRTAAADTRLEDYAAAMPVEKYQKEELLLINGLYPDRKLQPGDFYKVVE
ncbi:MAG: M48 family metalloprotease [Gammaproteobacteria bacterium]|nr:M48 family metalloprotease [Gammaproteobacteria bacterium]